MLRTGSFIRDDSGRTLILRGVNLGGSSKIPVAEPDKNSKTVSFVGRPFPQEDAEGHFRRLKNSGLTFIRFIVTWEALEHEGPGIYDESYLAYLRKILLAAEKEEISVFIDPHQDVWSRMTGGDGAPAWTMELLGMNLENLDAVGAAVTQENYGKCNGDKPYPQMIWPVNYSLYAAATMFTLFFGGNTYAPGVMVEGQSIQDFLQSKYIAAFRHCFRRLKNCGAIKGWGTMNEPHQGFIGYHDLRKLENVTLALGPVPSPFQAMIASSGRSVQVPVYAPWLKGWRVTGKKTINPEGLPLFKEGFVCPWKQAGIWAEEENGPRLLKPDHFHLFRGRPVKFCDDFLKPFMLRFMETMEEADRPLLFFIEGIPHGETPSFGKQEPQNTVNAFHHYDGLTLFTKTYRPWLNADPKTGRIILGRKKVKAFYSSKLAEAKTWAKEHMDDMPCLLGEFGLPFDLNHKKAYKTGDYSLHEDALSLYYDGVDENLLSSTIWNYSADNTNEEGDHWNGEDFSIVSTGRQSGERNGSGKISCKERAAGGWLRPYPMATAGIPLKFSWDRKQLRFYYRFRTDPAISSPTELFIPHKWFGEKPEISITANKKNIGLRIELNSERQRIMLYNDGYDGEAEVCVLNKNHVKEFS